MYLPVNIANRLIPLTAWFYLLGTKQIDDNLYQITDEIKLFLRQNTTDTYIKWEVFNHRGYFLEGFDIAPNDIVVDIGAHTGIFSVYAAQKAAEGTVLAYEPDPVNFELLQKNKKINNLSNLKLFPKAVSANDGEISLFFSKYNTGGHSIFPTDSSKKIITPAISLERIFEENNLQNIDYLKIDTEGSEFDIILNSPKSVFTSINKIALEYHDFFPTKHKHEDLQKYLISLGFTIYAKHLFWDRLFKTGMIFARRK